MQSLLKKGFYAKSSEMHMYVTMYVLIAFVQYVFELCQTMSSVIIILSLQWCTVDVDINPLLPCLPTCHLENNQ